MEERRAGLIEDLQTAAEAYGEAARRMERDRRRLHGLIREARAVVVIGSTVGLEALLYSKPVMTLGQPYYSGYGVTLDIDSLRELREGIPALLAFRPDRDRIFAFLHAAMGRCRPGKPVQVDDSDANAVQVAATLDDAARESVSSPLAQVEEGVSGLGR